MHLQELQDKISKLFANIAHPRVGAYIGLTEEVGELGKEIMEREIYGKETDIERIRAELADVIFSVTELSILYGIDLQSAVDMKLEKISAKIPKWETELAGVLKNKRQKFD